MNNLRQHAARATLLTLAMLAFIACAGSTPGSSASDKSAAPEYPLYELRTYTTNEGKLDDLQSRFRNHTMALFEKHGAKNIAYWTPTELPNTLIYIIAHKSAEARAASWKAFLEDPVWRDAYAASIAEGELVTNIDSVLMRATDYSPALP